MTELSNRNFGLLIAYLLPGFVALLGCGFVSPSVQMLLNASSNGPTVGGFLYLTLACTVLGATISTIRWAIVDRLHSWTGLRQPDWDFGRLSKNVAAFGLLIEVHYRYYQFHANMLCAVAALFVLYRVSEMAQPVGWIEVAALLTAIILFAGSRDNLKKYYERTEQLIGAQSKP